MLEIEKDRPRSSCIENSRCRRQWTCRKDGLHAGGNNDDDDDDDTTPTNANNNNNNNNNNNCSCRRSFTTSLSFHQ